MATSGAPQGFPPWAERRALWFLVCLHLPFVVVTPAFVIPRRDPSLAGTVAIVLAGLAIGGLQLRHSLAEARGERPRGWPWTFLALTLLACIPIWWFTWDWLTALWFVGASAAMVLRGLPRIVMVVAPIVGASAGVVYVTVVIDHENLSTVIVWAIYYLVIQAMGAGALFGSARLVRAVDELYATRTELAELAVGRERLRVSRDLHDLLGQSLSAVSLKGDLAMRLLTADRPAAARAEIESLTRVARGALHDVRAVAHDEHVVSLPAEIDAAAALLDAAGIEVHVAVDLADVAGPTEEVMAWAVREGATNLLRHSEARNCWLTATSTGGTVRLEMCNDGMRQPATDDDRRRQGRGLAGLSERARARSGSVSAEPTGDGRFRLQVEVPFESRTREPTA